MATYILHTIPINGCMIRASDVSVAGLDVWMHGDKDINPADARRTALMKSAQAGDRAAYTALLRECVPIIRAVAARHAPADRIDDAVQDTLLAIHRARHTFDPSRSFTAWLHTIASRRAIDILRRASREASREIHAPLLYEQYPDGRADPGEVKDRRDAALQIRHAVATLPAGQREAVQYLVLQEQTLAATARETGRTEGALKVNLHRAIKALRLKFERDRWQR